MVSRFGVSGTGIWIGGSGVRGVGGSGVQGFGGSGFPGFGFRVSRFAVFWFLRYGVSGSLFRFSRFGVSRYGVSGSLVFEVRGFEYGVWGMRFRVRG